MISKIKRVFAILIIAFCASCHSQTKTIHSGSSTTIHYVSVEKNVQLEVIDWGGKGKPVVLLAGGGNTAHVFDDFAPKLATHFHVYGITRRGFGASQFSPIDGKERLAKDILGVLDSLKIQNAVLVGHSFAGAELTSISRNVQNRVSALVYVEAGYPYAFSNSQSPSMNDFFNVKAPQQSSPGEKNLESFKALQDWSRETYGFQLPESELRQTWDSTPDGRPVRRRDAPGNAIFPIVLNNPQGNDSITLPSLVIFALPHSEADMIKSTDDSVRNESAIYFSKIDSLTAKQAKAFEENVPSARVLKLKGTHFIFISNESEVIDAIKQFAKKLK